jgi:hypothetical protein
MLAGFTPPFTPSARSALFPAPPWHYAGQVMSLTFAIDQNAGQSLLPAGFGVANGNAACHFCEWQSTTDGSELIDPVYSQYKEFFVVIEAERGDARALYCPFIYVDQDLSMIRGWLQGWPKKIGSVWMTRSYGLDHTAAAPIRPGTKLGASVTVKDRRLAEAVITLTGQPAEPIGFLGTPTFGLVASPTIVDGAEAQEPKLVRATISAKVQGPAHGASGTLSFFDSPRDELHLLRPRNVVAASVSTFALTIAGASLA